MYKQILFVILLSSISVISNAQIPQGFNYQAVIRDENGDMVADQLISLQFTMIT